MEPIILGSLDPIWLMFLQSLFTLLGIVIVVIVTWKIANRRIKAQFDIKREEIKIYKERALLELKLGVLKDVELLQNEYSIEGSKMNSIRMGLISIRDRINSYVDEEGLYEIVHKGVVEASNLSNINKEEGEDEKTDTEKELSLLNIIMVLQLTHEKLSYNLGFKTRTEEDVQREVDEVNLILGNIPNTE